MWHVLNLCVWGVLRTSKSYIFHFIRSFGIKNQCHQGWSGESLTGISPTYRCIASGLEAQMTQIEIRRCWQINLNASEWRQKTEQFIEIIKTEVLEEKTIQIDVLKKFLVSMNKIWWITKDKGGAGNFGISEKSKNFQQK